MLLAKSMHVEPLAFGGSHIPSPMAVTLYQTLYTLKRGDLIVW